MYIGQKGQDKWVIEEIFPGKTGGVFVDLAAADGVTHSNTIVLEKEFGWEGLCIEPNSEYFQNLLNIRNCKISNAVISDVEEKILFRTDNGQLGGIVADDVDNNDVVRGEELETAEIIELYARTINSVLSEFGMPGWIDYFSLDVEGAEERIVTTLDFQKYQFGCLTIERPTPIVNQTLFDQGYLFVKNSQYDTFYVHPKLQDERQVPCAVFEQIPKKDW